MPHDMVLILCALLIYAGLMWASTRIAAAIGQFTIVISPVTEKSAEELTEVQQHG